MKDTLKAEVKINGQSHEITKKEYKKKDKTLNYLNGETNYFKSGEQDSLRCLLTFLSEYNKELFNELFSILFVSKNKEEINEFIKLINEKYNNPKLFIEKNRKTNLKKYNIYTPQNNLIINLDYNLKYHEADLVKLFYEKIMGIKNRNLINNKSISEVLNIYYELNTNEIVDLKTYYGSDFKNLDEETSKYLDYQLSTTIDEYTKGNYKNTKCMNCKYSIWEKCPKTHGVVVDVVKPTKSNNIEIVGEGINRKNFENFPYVTTATISNKKGEEFKYSKENLEKLAKVYNYDQGYTLGSYSFKKKLCDYPFIKSGIIEYNENLCCEKYFVSECENYIPSQDILDKDISNLAKKKKRYY